MATELAAGYISLVPSARGFGRSIIREAQTAGNSAGDTASRHFGSRFISGMGTIGRRAGLALTAGLTAAAFFGVRVAADFEQTKIAFEGILGDVEKSNKLLGELRDFAAKTPFQFSGLADSAKQLLAVGFTAEDIIPTMTTLGNVAATLGVGEAEIAGVVRALGQMKGKGKASAEELQQISEQIPGFSAIQAIAEDMGITTAEAFEKMAKGAIPADEAIESILNGMEDFPGASGAMERQSKTLNGVLSTLKDNLEGMAIDFITPYLPALSSAVTAFSGFLEDTVVPALESVADSVGGFIDVVGPPVVAFISDHLLPTVQGLVRDGLQALSDWWGRNGEDILGFFDSLGDVAGVALETIGDWIWETVLPAFQDFGGWLIDNEAVLVGALAALTAGLTAYAAAAVIAAVANIIAFLPFFAILALLALAVGIYFLLADRGDGFLDVLIRTWGAIILIKDVYVDFFRSIWRWANRAWDAVEGLLDVINDLLEKAPGDGGLFGGLNLIVPGFGSGLGLLGEFDDGGIVPGRRGAPGLIIAHGGETVLPTHETPMPALFGGSGSLVGGDLVVQQMPGEDAGEATMRGLRKIRLMAGA